MKRFSIKQRNSKLRSAALLAAGSLVGAGVALLFAPHSGRKTRKSLVHIGEITGKGARNFQSDLNSRMDRFFQDIRHDLKSRFDDGKTWTDHKKGELEQALKAGKRHFRKEVAQVLHA
jgi:gas vesicle protein